MQLHGRGNFTPWTVPERADETVALYRFWAKLHTALVPYLASLAAEADLGAPPPMRPVGEGPAQWEGDWRYLLGDAFLVAPIVDDTGVRDVALPAGSRWLDWWNVDGPFLEGGQTLAACDATDRRRIPLFLREGALVPLEVVDAENGLGTSASRGRLTVLAVPGPGTTRFTLHLEEPGSTRALSLSATELTLADAPGGAVVKLLPAAPPKSFTVNGAPLPARASRAELDASEEGYFAQAGQRAVWMRLKPSAGQLTLAWVP
jgi:alpha-glucosidase (family GH31 glycosyl hydrolase)